MLNLLSLFNKKQKEKIEPTEHYIETENLWEIFDDPTQEGVLNHLKLDKEAYSPVFSKLKDYWSYKIGCEHGKSYLLYLVPELTKILSSPEDFEDIGYDIADSIDKVYGNGSHQFIGVIKSMIDIKFINTKDQLRKAMEVLSYIGSSEPFKDTVRTRYNGAQVFSDIETKLRRGEFNLLEQIIKNYPLLNAN